MHSGGGMYVDSSNTIPFVEWINKRIGVEVKDRCFFYNDASLDKTRAAVNVLDKTIQFAASGEGIRPQSKVRRKTFIGRDLSAFVFVR